jgi:predicted nucleic acid-binding protein
VDASVAVKWFISESHSEEALRVRGGPFEILAPAHMRVEVANTFWKRHRRGDLTFERAHAGVVLVSEHGTIREPRTLGSLLPAAIATAIAHHGTVYEALYVALALAEGCQFVTADRALYNSLAPIYPETMLWVEDIPGPAEPGPGPD